MKYSDIDWGQIPYENYRPKPQGFWDRLFRKLFDFSSLRLDRFNISLGLQMVGDFKYYHVYGHLGDNIEAGIFHFDDNEDWQQVLSLFRDLDTSSFASFAASRNQGDYYVLIQINLKERIMFYKDGLIGGIGVPNPKDNFTEWSIQPTSSDCSWMKRLLTDSPAPSFQHAN